MILAPVDIGAQIESWTFTGATMLDPLLIQTLHHLEQLGEASKPFAAYLARFHRALVDEGFTREEALELVGIMQRQLTRNMGRDTEGQE